MVEWLISMLEALTSSVQHGRREGERKSQEKKGEDMMRAGDSPAIPGPKRLRQEDDHEFEASPGYTTNSKPTWAKV